MADAEGRDWDSVARDLILADTNQVRVRLIDAYEDGSIPAQAGVALIQNSWKMIVAAARSAANPEPSFTGGYGSKRIREYLKTVRLGQTERGSFVVNLLSPSAIPMDAPHSRGEKFPDKVVSTLISGLESTKKTLIYGQYLQSSQIPHEYIHSGMSADMCDALAGIAAKSGDAGLEISVNWAIVGYANGKKTSSVAFDKSHVPKLKRATSTLKSMARTTKIPTKQQTYVFDGLDEFG